MGALEAPVARESFSHEVLVDSCPFLRGLAEPEAEAEADAKADPWLLYGHYGGYYPRYTATMVTMDMEVSGVARRGRLKLPPLLMLTLPLMLMLKLTHGFCMEATILEVTILDTTVIMVLDMDMDLYGVARRGRPKPKLPLLLMLMPIPGCIMDMVATMALVTTIEDGEATGGEDTDTGVD